MSFSINSGEINSAPINGNSPAITEVSGSGQLAAIAQNIYAQGVGKLSDVAQTVAIIGQGQLATIGQVIELRATGSGALVPIIQAVKSNGLGKLGSISQRVRNVAINYDFNQGTTAALFGSESFDVSVTIGGEAIPNNQVIGAITITRNEDDNALCDLSIYPSAGSHDLNQWHGKTVVITVATPGYTETLYRGMVDIPDIDLIGKMITLRCTDARTEKNNKLSDGYLSNIGYWSADVFSEPKSQSDKLEQRLKTIQASFDYDAEGVGRLTDWKPKTIPDYTLEDSAIFRRNPSVTVLSRGRVTNKVEIELEFQYQRLRHREIDYSFDSELSACLYSAWGMPPTSIQMQQAITAAGWPFTNYSIVGEGVDPAGRYNCNGVTLLWATTSRTGDTVSKKDANGDQIYDAKGDPVYTVENQKTTSIKGVYAQACSWKASKRWAQNVSEKLTLTVQAPQSIAQYGEVKTKQSYGVVSEYDTQGWEDYTAYSPAPANSVTSANGDKVLDKDTNGLQAWQSAALCALHLARTEILKGHRDNVVTFETPLWPKIGLHHTVETTGGTVKAKGKVSRIVHTLNLSERDCSTEVELSVSQSMGSTTDSGTPVPARPTIVDDSGSVATSIKLGPKTIPVGGLQDPQWQGYIFQQLVNSGSSYGGLKGPVALIVDTPAIEEAARGNREANASQVYIVDIRNDTLEVIF